MLDAEKDEQHRPTFSDHLANRVTAFSGSMLFVAMHIVWFTAWIVVNTVILSQPFDKFPFTFLTMTVSLEAIFLSTFVLISQNRQALLADRRARIDLQINLLAEQEVTKLVEMVAEIHERAGLSGRADPDVQEMKERTDVRDVAHKLDTIAGDEPGGQPR